MKRNHASTTPREPRERRLSEQPRDAEALMAERYHENNDGRCFLAKTYPQHASLERGA